LYGLPAEGGSHSGRSHAAVGPRPRKRYELCLPQPFATYATMADPYFELFTHEASGPRLLRHPVGPHPSGPADRTVTPHRHGRGVGRDLPVVPQARRGGVRLLRVRPPDGIRVPAWPRFGLVRGRVTLRGAYSYPTRRPVRCDGIHPLPRPRSRALCQFLTAQLPECSWRTFCSAGLRRMQSHQFRRWS